MSNTICNKLTHLNFNRRNSSMDQDEDLAQLKWILIAGIAFLFSAFFAFQELKYFVWGTTAEATVTNTFETRERRRNLLAVEYTFTDKEGQHHSERDDVPSDWPTPGPKVTIQYMPGVEDSSRLEGHSRTGAVWVFFVCCGLLVFAGFKLYQIASDAIDGPPRRRKR